MNRVVTTKSKNSRMGKGVGTKNRYSFYVKPSKPIFIFQNSSLMRIKNMLIFFTKRTNITFVVKKTV